jgi:glycosyltransferase involved in cell wall biosynthesis
MGEVHAPSPGAILGGQARLDKLGETQISSGRSLANDRNAPVKSTLAVLVLNEIEAIEQVLPRIRRDWVDEIIVVDGGSTDGTIEYCEGLGFPVLRQKQRGYGRGMIELMEVAKGDIIIEFMGDGNCRVETIPLLVDKVREGFDLVIASRYMAGARSYDDTPVTRLGNWAFTRIINLAFGAHLEDAMMGYRAYRRDAFRQLEMDSPGLCFPTQGTIQFARFGFKIAEIPSDEPARLGGVRKAKNVRTGLELCAMIGKEMYREYVLRSSRHRGAGAAGSGARPGDTP